jgi:hypothetical protein
LIPIVKSLLKIHPHTEFTPAPAPAPAPASKSMHSFVQDERIGR